MGKYTRKSKVIREVSVMAELGPQGGKKTRARTLSMEESASTEAKRSKIYSKESELEFSSSFNHQVQKNQKNQRLIITPEMLNSPATSPDNSGVISSSGRCSSNGSCDFVSGNLMRSLEDLEGREGLKFEFSSRYFFNRIKSDLVSNKELKKLESTVVMESEEYYRKTTSEQMPTESELDDFFSEFEKDEQKRFEEKYNYDIVKDIPLEGRYEWIPLKQ